MDVFFVCWFWVLGFVVAIAWALCDSLYLNNKYMILKERKKTPPIPLVLYATWYFFHNACTSEYNVFYSDIQDPCQEPTNPDHDLL